MMSERLFRAAEGLGINLRNGARLLAFQRVPAGEFVISVDQSVLLVLFHATAVFAISYALSLPEPEFSYYGLANITTEALLLFLSAYVLVKAVRTEHLLLPLLVALLSMWPWIYLAWLVIGEHDNFSYWQFFGDRRLQYEFYNLWIAAVFVATATRILGGRWRFSLVALVTYGALVGIPLQFVSLGSFWHLAYDYDGDYAEYLAINEEDTYYRQFELVNAVKGVLLHERPGVPDIYFVGFGGDAMEDVFMKEVQYARNVFDEQFGTKGRSVALINNLKTMNETPLATANNLRLLVKHIGSLMNPDEDVLFLYLTSHGSETHQLSTNLMPLTLNEVGPQALKSILDEAGIRYRVVLVSSCYSGGFVEPLKDEYTAVVTASAADRTSFGCGTKSDFTYFGRALFEEQLRNNPDFLDAFQKTIESIEKREQEEKKDPSEPQLFVGDAMRQKLEQISREFPIKIG